MKIDKDRILLIIIAIFPLIIASAFAAGIQDFSLIGEVVSGAPEFSPQDLILQAIISTLLGSLVVFSLFTMMNRRAKGAKKLVVAFIVSPILFFVSIFIGQTFLLLLFKGSPAPLHGLILSVSLAVSMLSLVLILIDAFPPMIRNLFVAFYGSIFGIFMGVTIVTSSMFVLMVSLIVEDYLLTKYSPVAQPEVLTGKIGKDPFDYTRIQSERVAIGVGDYIAFSLLASHAFLYFPIYVWAMSLLLAAVGVIVNVTVLAEEEKILPAIPLPGLLAIFPWVVHIGMLISVAI